MTDDLEDGSTLVNINSATISLSFWNKRLFQATFLFPCPISKVIYILSQKVWQNLLLSEIQ